MKNKIFLIFAVLTIVIGWSFYKGFAQSCDKTVDLSYSQRQLCWYNKIKIQMDAKGVASALKYLGVLYRKYPSFASTCHDVTHLIGKEAYNDYKSGKKFTFPEETSWCGYGFYHGFVENMLAGKNGYQVARDFCESVNENPVGNIANSVAIYSCYHGIGHATFDNYGYIISKDANAIVTPAIKACEDATKGLVFEKTKQCVTGVFNALANAYGLKTYGLELDQKDPVSVCRLQSKKYSKYCFLEVSLVWIHDKMGHYDFTFGDGAKYIQSIGDVEGEKSSIESLASEYGHLHQSFVSDNELIKNCRTLRPDLFKSCIDGTLLGLLNWGTPGSEYKRAISFCANNIFESKEEADCYEYVFKNLPSHYSKDKLLKICNTVKDKYKDQCVLPTK